MSYYRFLLMVSLLIGYMNNIHANNIVARDIYKTVLINSLNNEIKMRSSVTYDEAMPGPMIFILEDAKNGQVVLAKKEMLIIYTPSANFSGLDSIAYEACLPGRSACDQAKIYIVIAEEVNVVNSFKVVGEKDDEVPISKIPFYNNFTSYSGSNLLKIIIEVLPAVGTLYQAGGIVQAGQEIDIDALDLIYIPENDFLGEINFRWNAADENGYALENAVANIQIVDIGVEPFVQYFEFEVDENDFYQFSFELFDAAYIDIYDDALQYVRVETLPEHGDLRLKNAVIHAGDSIAANDLNALAYRPRKDFIGGDAFEWRASNSRYFSFGSAQVGIEVMKVNEAPWLWYENAAVDNISYSIFTDEALDFCLEFYDKHDDAVRVQAISQKEPTLIKEGEACFTLPGQSEPGALQYVFTLCDDESPNMCRDVFVTIDVKDIPPPPQYYELSYSLLEGERLEACLDYNGAFEAEFAATLPVSFSLSTDGCFEYSAPFDGNQKHDITISYCDENGEYCEIYQLTIDVEALPSLVFYDGISPNSDGKNDSWIIENIQYYPENRLKIINRWGESVYEVENYDNETTVWGGTSLNHRERLASGVYFYDLEISGFYASRFRGTILIKY